MFQDLKSLCKQKLFRDAFRAYDVIEKNGDCVVDASTFTHLISACSSLRSAESARKIHNHISKSSLLPDMILENHIVKMYGKCGLTKDARKVFDNMPERNVVMWTSLIDGYSQDGRDPEAVKLYVQMQQSGFGPDHFTFGSVIKACSSLADADLGRQLHARVIKSEYGSHLIAQNALIAMYTKFARINEACGVFSCIEKKDLISWSSMISGFSKLGYELEGLSCFKEMLSQGTYIPNEFIFGSVFSACGSLVQPEYGRQIHAICIKYGFEGDAFAGCSLTDMYAKCGFWDSAENSFPPYTKSRYCVVECSYSGLCIWRWCERSHVIFFSNEAFGQISTRRDHCLVRTLLCGFTYPFTLSQGKQVHSYIIKIGLNLDISVCNTLLTMYANCSGYVDAYKMFDDIRSNADLVSWNAIITMCMHQNQVAEVFSLFKTMLLFHGRPDYITLANVLGACGKVSSLGMGDQVYCCATKKGLESDIMVVNGLIDMYVKCGSIERARKLFDCTRNTDVISWSSLIVGYAQFDYVHPSRPEK